MQGHGVFPKRKGWGPLPKKDGSIDQVAVVIWIVLSASVEFLEFFYVVVFPMLSYLDSVLFYSVSKGV